MNWKTYTRNQAILNTLFVLGLFAMSLILGLGIFRGIVNVLM